MIIISQDGRKIITRFDSLVIETFETIDAIKAITNGRALEIGVYYANGKAQEILIKIATHLVNENALRKESVFAMPANIYIEVIGRNEHYGWVECEIRRITPWGEMETLLKTDEKTAEALFFNYYNELCASDCDARALEREYLKKVSSEEKGNHHGDK